MSSLVYLVPLALLLGGVALGAFLWCLKSGQYDDLKGLPNASCSMMRSEAQRVSSKAQGGSAASSGAYAR